MEFLLHSGLAVSTIMVVLILLKKSKSPSDYILFSWIAAIFFQILFYERTIYGSGFVDFMAILGFSLPLLSLPSLYLYIIGLTGEKISNLKVILHFSIFPIYFISFLVLRHLYDFTIVAKNGTLMFQNAPAYLTYYYAIPLAIAGLYYVIQYLLLLRQHKVRLRELFSYSEEIDLKWLQYLIYIYILSFLIINAIVFGFSNLNLLEVEQAFGLLGVTLSGLVIAAAIYGLKQTDIFAPSNHVLLEPATDQHNSKYKRSGLKQDLISTYASKVNQLLNEEKVFLNENLSLPKLAELCNISAPQLSQVINQNFKVSFYDLINKHRVKEAKRLIVSSEHQHLTLLAIALDCGFKSKASFNRHFKKHTGITPSKFKNQS